MALVEKIKCPACGSDEISKPLTSRQGMAISLLLLGFPLPFLNQVYHCFNCGLDFKKKPNKAGTDKTSQVIENL